MADAPRFRLWWGHVEDKSVLQMRRGEWTELVGEFGRPVEIDISRTPLRGVADASSLVTSVAHRFGPATARVSVFRYDESDMPTPYNQDEYDVWLDLQQHPRLHEMISAASTSDNENFRDFCRGHVFLAKRRAGPDHWLASIPSSITALLKSSG